MGRGRRITHQSSRKVLEVDGQGRLNRSTTGNDAPALQRPLDDAQGVMQRPLHLVEHVVVRASQDDAAGAHDLCALDEDELVVGYPLLHDLICETEVCRLERLVPLEVGERGDERGARGSRDPSQVLFATTTHGHRAGFDKLLETEIVDALGGEDDVGPRGEDLADALECDLGFSGRGVSRTLERGGRNSS